MKKITAKFAKENSRITDGDTTAECAANRSALLTQGGNRMSQTFKLSSWSAKTALKNFKPIGGKR